VRRFRLPPRDARWVELEPARYAIEVNGHLGAMILSAFPTMASESFGRHTVLTGLLDRSALYGVLAEIEALGLELVEVRRITQPCPEC
jgi:hypothetical protein